MSAIAGMLAFDGRPIARAAVQLMADRLSRRGGPETRIWSSRSVGLTERLSRPQAPDCAKLGRESTASRYIVVADARIDNRADISKRMGVNPAEASDQELIALLYDTYHDDCPQYIEGDFAFAVWDIAERALFCARDRFGIKPLYYYIDDITFAFASELKAFKPAADLHLRLNEDRIIDYMLCDLHDQAITFYKACFRLPPAHTLVIRGTGLTIRRYWALDPERAITGRSAEDCVSEFLTLFKDAVSCRIPHGEAFGAMLSGGLDSSAIVCTARALLSRTTAGPLHTFSVIFDDLPQSDERAYIREIVDSGQAVSHFIKGSELGPLDDLDRVWSSQDEPFYAPNLFLHSALYKRAREAGVGILLDGLDGDLTVSHGIGYLVELARAGRLIALRREITQLARRCERNPLEILMRHVVMPLVPNFVRTSLSFVRDHAMSATDHDHLLSTEIIGRPEVKERIRRLRASRWEYKSAREFHYRGLAQGFISFLLEVADRAAATHAIEPRYPFFDRRLVEFCLALPGRYKLENGWTRVILRQAMEHILPSKVQWRPGKSDLSPNFVKGLLERNHHIVHEAVHSNWPFVDRYINRSALVRLYKRCLSDQRPGDILATWRTVTLMLWLRRDLHYQGVSS